MPTVEDMTITNHGRATCGSMISMSNVVTFNENELTPKELNHARLTNRVCAFELRRYAYIMQEHNCSYTEAVFHYNSINKSNNTD